MFVQALLIALVTWISVTNFIELFVWSLWSGAPLIGGTLVGWILGDVRTGMAIGATTQLIYMGQINIGGVSPVNYAFAGCLGTAMAMLTNSAPDMGAVIAVSFGLLGLICDNARKIICTFIVHKCDKYAAEGNTKGVMLCNAVFPHIVTFVLYAVPTFFAIYFGAEYFQSFLNMLPPFILTGLKAMGMLLPALGLALLFKAVYKIKFLSFFIIGFVFAAYLKLGIIPIALIAISCALLYWFSEKEPNTKEVV